MNTADIRAQISRAQELDAKSGLLTQHLTTRLPHLHSAIQLPDSDRNAVMTRTSPAELGEARVDAILDFDQISDTIAWVKPQLQMFGGVMQDYLNLVKLDGQWWIMAKMWARVADAKP